MRRLSLSLALALWAALPCAAQTFPVPLNNASSTLAADHAVGSGTLVLKAGDGAMFGSPSPSAPVRVTVAAKSTLVGGSIGAGTTVTIFDVTARSGDTLSGLTPVEGTSDHAYSRQDPVAALVTAGFLSGLQSAVAGKAVDAAVVHLAAKETLTQPKTIAYAQTASPSSFGQDASLFIQQTDGAGNTSGNACITIRSAGRPPPTDIITVYGSDGNLAIGAWFDLTNCRNADGSHRGVAVAATAPQWVLPHMQSIWPDIAGPALKIQHDSTIEGCAAIAFYDQSDPDPHFPAAALAGPGGKLRGIIRSNLRLDWGSDLGVTPYASRQGSLYFDTNTVFPTIAGPPANGSTTGLDLAIATGGTSQVRFGSNGASYDYKISVPTAAQPTVTHSVNTSLGPMTALQLLTTSFGTLASAPLLGVGTTDLTPIVAGNTLAAKIVAGSSRFGFGTNLFSISNGTEIAKVGVVSGQAIFGSHSAGTDLVLQAGGSAAAVVSASTLAVAFANAISAGGAVTDPAATLGGYLVAGNAGTFKTRLGSVLGDGFPGLWFGSAAPSFSNYAFLADTGGGGTLLNGPTYLELRIANGGKMRLNATGVGFFGATPAGQQTGGAATADGTYDATEQGMIQRTYDAMRSYGLLN